MAYDEPLEQFREWFSSPGTQAGLDGQAEYVRLRMAFYAGQAAPPSPVIKPSREALDVKPAARTLTLKLAMDPAEQARIWGPPVEPFPHQRLVSESQRRRVAAGLPANPSPPRDWPIQATPQLFEQEPYIVDAEVPEIRPGYREFPLIYSGEGLKELAAEQFQVPVEHLEAPERKWRSTWARLSRVTSAWMTAIVAATGRRDPFAGLARDGRPLVPSPLMPLPAPGVDPFERVRLSGPQQAALDSLYPERRATSRVWSGLMAHTRPEMALPADFEYVESFNDG